MTTKTHVMVMPDFIQKQVSDGIDTFGIVLCEFSIDVGDYIEFHGDTKMNVSPDIFSAYSVIKFRVIEVRPSIDWIMIQRVHPLEKEVQGIKKNTTTRLTSY